MNSHSGNWNVSRRWGANALGALTILSWGSLGLLGKVAAGLPSYFILSVCFAGATVVGLVFIACRNDKTGSRRPVSYREVFVGGVCLFAYHLFYFQAFHHAPALEVSLLNYLWPGFIIIIGNLFFGLRSGIRGVFAAALGFLGVVVLFGADVGKLSDPEHLFGFGLATFGAMIWATYSNLRRVGDSDVLAAVTAICAIAAGLACSMSVGLETFPILTATQVWTLVLLTLGPAGGAFYLWDVALKHGDAARLAVLGYAAPVISTLLLVATGYADPTFSAIVATSLIAVGGLVTKAADNNSSDWSRCGKKRSTGQN